MRLNRSYVILASLMLCRHAWMSYMVDKPPSEDKLMQRLQRPWEPEKHRPVLSASKSAFKTYSTYVNYFLQLTTLAPPC